MANRGRGIVILPGNSCKDLAYAICKHLDHPLGAALVSQYADGETRVEIQENIRGSDVFIIQSTSQPVNHHLMEALLLADACRRASASYVTLVAPYFGYARQERKSAPRQPISAKLVAELIETAGFDRLVSLELHNVAIQGFFSIPVDHLYCSPIFVPYLKEKYLSENTVIISPDAGGVERARAIAKGLSCGIAVIDKRRDRPNHSAVMHLVGDVKGKKCLIIDDIVDTGGSLIRAAEAVMKEGASRVDAAIVHPVLSGQALEAIEKSCLSALITTNSIPIVKLKERSSKLISMNIAELMAKAIKRIHNQESISSLFS